jgi:hypothetical protein
MILIQLSGLVDQAARAVSLEPVEAGVLVVGAPQR